MVRTIWLFLMRGSLFLIASLLGVMHVLMRSGIMLRRKRDLLCDNGAAIAIHGLHGNRNSQRVAAKQRKPEGQ